MEIDQTHSIQLVASVSYDRNKKQFNYDNFNPAVFGGGQAVVAMKEKQDKSLNQARIRFDDAD